MKCFENAIKRLKLGYWPMRVIEALENEWLEEAIQAEDNKENWTVADFASLRVIAMAYLKSANSTEELTAVMHTPIMSCFRACMAW